MKKILVTGGAGFIGSHTVDLLLQRDMKVVVLDNLSTGKLSYLNLFHPNLRIRQADILDYKIVEEEVRQSDIVLHLAALSSVPKSVEDPINSLKVNTLGFLHLLQAIRENPRPTRLIYASSAAIYGSEAPLPCSDNPPLPEAILSPYALEKANNERYAALYATLFNINCLGLRYFNVYGPRQDPKSPYSGVISQFIHAYQEHIPVTLYGDGNQSRDFIHVSDVAEANWQAIQSEYTGVLNIATGVPETLNHLINYLETADPKGGHLSITRAPARTGDILHSYADTKNAIRYLDFYYKIPLSLGIKSLVTGVPIVK